MVSKYSISAGSKQSTNLFNGCRCYCHNCLYFGGRYKYVGANCDYAILTYLCMHRLFVFCIGTNVWYTNEARREVNQLYNFMESMNVWSAFINQMRKSFWNIILAFRFRIQAQSPSYESRRYGATTDNDNDLDHLFPERTRHKNLSGVRNRWRIQSIRTELNVHVSSLILPGGQYKCSSSRPPSAFE